MSHEYSVLGGINRAAIGRYISGIAAMCATLLGAGAAWLVDVAKTLGLADHIPGLIFWPLTAGAIYSAIYWIFNSYVWRYSKIAKLLKVPNLEGTWMCQGQTINPDKTKGYTWPAEITIVQTWDKLRIRLKTNQSASNSVAAALTYDEVDGYRLIYNYKNELKIDEPELMSHRGSAELLFSSDLKTATGEYFNGHGRYTFGTMKLTRKE
ncbi:MAG: hypothetical protein EOP12_01640 [Pseudomonas sp.]|nr:MAG: hypothetical protein EOP12_01640 [Pseudomonas sp.]